MAVALDDVLLVLLGRADASAYDLWHRHIAIFGSRRRVDIVRIMAAEQIYRAVTILSGHPYHRV